MNHETVQMPDPVQLASAKTVGIVGDRAPAAGLLTVAEGLGGGWIAGARSWAAGSCEFLLLLANRPQRVERRAPLIVMADALPLLMRYACTQLDDVACFWVMLLAPAAQQSAREIILADCVTEGRA